MLSAIDGAVCFHTSNDADLGDSVRVTENDTDLRGRGTLAGKTADLLLDLGRSGLEPGRGSARVGDGRSRNSLSVGVKTSHCDRCSCRLVVVVVGKGSELVMLNKVLELD